MAETVEMIEVDAKAVPNPDGVKTRLLSRFRYADNYRQQWDDRAIQWYKQYVGYREPLLDEDGKPLDRSNLHIPLTYGELDTLRARIVKSFFSSRPYMDFLPMPPDGDNVQLTDLDEEKAQIAAATIDEQLDQNQILRRFYDFVTSFLVFPAAIMSVGWRFEERTVRRRVPQVVNVKPIILPNGTLGVEPVIQLVEIEQQGVVWDDNELQNVDFFDFWPDPRGHDIDSCRFVFQREHMTREQIEDTLALLEQAGSGTVYPIDWDEVQQAGSSLDEGKWERLSAVGLSPETRDDAQNDPDGNESQSALYEVLHYWEDERRGILINRTALAYYGDSPYWRHGKKPFAVAVFEPLPNEFYGLCGAQILEGLQAELNTHRNQRVDNVSLVLNRMWKVSRSADIDESELVSKPHGVVYVDNPDDVEPLTMPDVTASSYNEEQIIKTDMENVLGVPDVVRGASSEHDQTATEVVTKTTSAGIRFDVKIMLYEVMGLKRIAHLMDMNNQQFLDDPRWVRIFGEQGMQEWRRVDPMEIIGEHDYRPAGANVDPAANKETRRQQLMQIYEVALKTKDQGWALDEIRKALVESFDFRNPEKFVLDEQEQAQQIFKQMQLQQLLNGGQSPGNGPGNGAPGGLPNGIPGGPQGPPMAVPGMGGVGA